MYLFVATTACTAVVGTAERYSCRYLLVGTYGVATSRYYTVVAAPYSHISHERKLASRAWHPPGMQRYY